MTPLRRFFVVVAVALLAAAGAGCGKKRLARNNAPLKEWVVGNWVRLDDSIVWQYQSNGEMMTTGQIPVAGSYETVEPDTVKVLISGGNAITTSMQLGVPVEPQSQSLTLTFKVKDDEMRVVGMKSDVVWRRSAK